MPALRRWPRASRCGLPCRSSPAAADQDWPPRPGKPAAGAAPPRLGLTQGYLSFGFGVPLRTIVGKAADLRTGSVLGGVALRPQVGSGDPPVTDATARRPGSPFLRRLRPQAQSACSCGCTGPCRCQRRGSWL